MDNHFSELEDAWNQSKKNLEGSSINIDQMYEKIRANKKESLLFYYGTIAILSMTLIVISCFFYFVAPVQELLSRLGASLMIGGLVVRIIYEVISIGKAKTMHTIDNSLNAVNHSISFYQFRKNIHGKIAPIIISLYTIGFYLLTPEFLLYMSVQRVIFFDVFYLFIALFLFFQIRKGVRKEMASLKKILNLRKEITDNNPE